MPELDTVAPDQEVTQQALDTVTPTQEVVQDELDPSIASIIINGCPFGHSADRMTVGQMHADPKLRPKLEEPLKNIEVLKQAQVDPETAVRIALGGLALTDKEGHLVREQSETQATSKPQPEGSKKK